VVPSLIDRPTLAAALAAGQLGLALFNLPFHLGLVAATIAGVGLGLALESATQPRDEDTIG